MLSMGLFLERRLSRRLESDSVSEVDFNNLQIKSSRDENDIVTPSMMGELKECDGLKGRRTGGGGREGIGRCGCWVILNLLSGFFLGEDKESVKGRKEREKVKT